jgi:4-diphosphocytidyl-2-C-methyl-D-erythritol kinase
MAVVDRRVNSILHGPFGSQYVVRVGTVLGTTFTNIYSETFTQAFTWNGGEYMTWTLTTPVLLSANTTYGVDIGIEKRIPMGGGLGGGSSDAATTLMALNRLWHTGLDSLQLQGIGLALGADVPFFVHGRTAFAEGVGERFTDVTPPAAWYLVLVPDVAVPTPEIFRSAQLRRDTPAIVATDWHPGFGHNDLEAVACALYPEVTRHLDWLRHYGDARMSGSGACCFVEVAEELAARAALAALPADMCGFVARGLDRHPLVLI